MRSIFVAAVAAACVLVASVASAEGNTCVRRPLVTVAPTPLGQAVLTVEASDK
jgi:hypothetical protein